MNAIVIFVTAPNRSDAEKLAETIVEQRLAACVQIVPEIISVYRWQNRIERETEVLLLIKTTDAQFADLEIAIRAAHAYDVPEILAVPASRISAAYFEWLRENTR